MIVHLYCPLDTDWLDIFSKIASIIIALLGLIFTAYIFRENSRKEKNRDKESKQFDSLKTIILEHNLKHFFSFYENVISDVQPLSKKSLSDNSKRKINDNMVSSLKELRLNFTDLLLAVDNKLYEQIKNNTDDLIDELTETMFDDGINLNHKPKFESEIITKLSTSKTENVRILYTFNH